MIIYSDGKLVTFEININNLTVTRGQETTITSFNKAYSPNYVAFIPSISNVNNIGAIITDGDVKIRNMTNTNGNMWGSITLPLKTPLY